MFVFMCIVTSMMIGQRGAKTPTVVKTPTRSLIWSGYRESAKKLHSLMAAGRQKCDLYNIAPRMAKLRSMRSAAAMNTSQASSLRNITGVSKEQSPRLFFFYPGFLTMLKLNHIPILYHILLSLCADQSGLAGGGVAAGF